MRRTVFLLVFLFFIAPAKVFAQAGGYQMSQYLSGLNQPTAMAFSPDGRIFVSEKTGRLRVVKNNQLLSTPFLTVSVNTLSERGLLGVAFDPNFSSNRYVYVYYTRSLDPIKNRLSRFMASTTNPDQVEPGSERILVDGIASDAGNHNGGAVLFGPDGKLYFSVGDGGATSTNSQDLSNLSGKISRINADGTIPPDNPFFGQAGRRGEIWAWGLRNPFTFAFDRSGIMNINDVGQSSREEINRGARGANYGWPTCEGSCNVVGMTNPIYSYGRTEGQAIAGGAFWNGEYFFGDYVAGWIKKLNSLNTPVSVIPSVSSPVDLKVGPDNNLYVLSFSGSIFRVQSVSSPSPTPSQNPADGNMDNRVDGQDYVLWLNNFGLNVSEGKRRGDYNLDLRVDGQDYIMWLNNFGFGL